MTPQEAAALVDGGALLLDVREPEEWQAGHAAGAVWIPMGELLGRLPEVPRDRRVVAVCRVGGRSERVAGALLQRGYDVVNLAGGMQAWASAGLDVVSDDGTPGTVV